ncbi:MAG: isoprenylcysteine carboxylmethyltransferase family protein [Candidatus Omnitrophica bacterium]|nr:isoprenylcysteine carboxylmethyltransferase family protein [Candidatus Omnitrophota bacterium]
MKKRIKLHGSLIFLAILALVIFPGYLLIVPRGVWLDSLCALAIIWGYFIRICSRGLKSELNPDGHTLVTIGPYKVTRNPMYFGTFVIGLGVSFMLFRWWVAPVFFAVYLAIYLPLIKGEEKALSERFQNTFKDYCRNTNKFFPKNIIFDLPVKPAWIKKELLSSLAPVIFLIAVIQSWADFKLFGLVRLQERFSTLGIFFGLLLIFTGLAVWQNKKYGISGKR